MPKITMACRSCGSDDVRCDAYAAWNVEAQQWELAETFDARFCMACDGETHVEEREA